MRDYTDKQLTRSKQIIEVTYQGSPISMQTGPYWVTCVLTIAQKSCPKPHQGGIVRESMIRNHDS